MFARMKSGAGKRVFACVYLRALLVKGAGDLADYDRHDHKKTGMNKEKEKFPAGRLGGGHVVPIINCHNYWPPLKVEREGSASREPGSLRRLRTQTRRT